MYFFNRKHIYMLHTVTDYFAYSATLIALVESLLHMISNNNAAENKCLFIVFVYY